MNPTAYSCEFIVPGKPQGKQRPRVLRTGITYTPKETKEYEALVRAYFLAAIGGEDCRRYRGPVQVALEIHAEFRVPKAWPKWKRRAALAGLIPHLSKPDWDNIGKIVADALRDLAYADDSQVTLGVVRKRYATEDALRVVVTGRAVPETEAEADAHRRAAGL